LGPFLKRVVSTRKRSLEHRSTLDRGTQAKLHIGFAFLAHASPPSLLARNKEGRCGGRPRGARASPPEAASLQLQRERAGNALRGWEPQHKEKHPSGRSPSGPLARRAPFSAWLRASPLLSLAFPSPLHFREICPLPLSRHQESPSLSWAGRMPGGLGVAIRTGGGEGDERAWRGEGWERI
jgi:hypothetical protein